jgi:hypothetical protein
MLNRCIAAGELKQAIGIALESHRLDIVESAIAKSKGDEMLKYTLEVSMTLVQNLGFRNQACCFLFGYLNLLLSFYYCFNQFIFIYLT